MGFWHQTRSSLAPAIAPPPRRQRRHYRHQMQGLAYLNLDESNGGIIRNLGDAGIAVQAVSPLRLDQMVLLRFELANPRTRVEGTGRVAWADTAGQAGIEFLTLSLRSRPALKEWIFLQLLTTAQATANPDFVDCQVPSELLFSSTSHPAIRFAHGVRGVSLEIDEDERPRLLDLPWFPFAVSAEALAYLVDGLILLSAVLLFAVICIAMIGAVPAWPIVLAVGFGAGAVFAILYRFLFLFWIGGTPGSYLAGLTGDANGMNLEADERPRFR
jgi:hypothetical protein